MRKAGIEAIIAFGTNWQEAYLRYVSDFCILEGSGVAMLTADGRCRLVLDSVTEAERAQEEARGRRGHVRARIVAGRRRRCSNRSPTSGLRPRRRT